MSSQQERPQTLRESAERYIGTTFGSLSDRATRQAVVDVFMAGAYAATEGARDPATAAAIAAETAAWREIKRAEYHAQRAEREQRP